MARLTVRRPPISRSYPMSAPRTHARSRTGSRNRAARGNTRPIHVGIIFAYCQVPRSRFLVFRDRARAASPRRGNIMADARNIAHDKMVQDKKKHDGEEVAEGAIVTPQPGRKPKLEEDTGERDTFQQHSRQHQGDETAK